MAPIASAASSAISSRTRDRFFPVSVAGLS